MVLNIKKISLPTISEHNTSYIIKYENTPIAQITNKIINLEGENKNIKKINSFYDSFAQKYDFWCNSSFETYASDDYINDTNPRKKYRYRPFLLEFDMTYEELTEKHLKIITQVRLSKNRKLISKKELCHVWNISNATLCIKKR